MSIWHRESWPLFGLCLTFNMTNGHAPGLTLVLSMNTAIYAHTYLKRPNSRAARAIKTWPEKFFGKCLERARHCWDEKFKKTFG